jgi:hypothetical protein
MLPANAICVSPQQQTLQALLGGGSHRSYPGCCGNDSSARLTADSVTPRWLDNLWEALLTSLRADFLSLDERLAGVEPCSDRPLAIASIPCGYVQNRSIGL